MSKDATVVKSPKGGIINVALCEPNTLSKNPSTGYLWSGAETAWIVSSLTGQTVYFCNTGVRQICIMPFAHGWHHFVAVLSKVLNQEVIFFQSFKGGLSFRTSQHTGLDYPKKMARADVALINGLALPAGWKSK